MIGARPAGFAGECRDVIIQPQHPGRPGLELGGDTGAENRQLQILAGLGDVGDGIDQIPVARGQHKAVIAGLMDQRQCRQPHIDAHLALVVQAVLPVAMGAGEFDAGAAIGTPGVSHPLAFEPVELDDQIGPLREGGLQPVVEPVPALVGLILDAVEEIPPPKRAKLLFDQLAQPQIIDSPVGAEKRDIIGVNITCIDQPESAHGFFHRRENR